MIVKILGFKISLEILILLLVIYLVMMVHALASCCNGRAIAEGYKDMVGTNSKHLIQKLKDKVKDKKKTYRIENNKLVENIII